MTERRWALPRPARIAFKPWPPHCCRPATTLIGSLFCFAVASASVAPRSPSLQELNMADELNLRRTIEAAAQRAVARASINPTDDQLAERLVQIRRVRG